MFFAILAVAILSVSALFQRLAMKKEGSDPIASSIIFQLLLTAGSVFVVLFTGFSLPDASKWPYFLASGALYAFGSYFIFRASKAIEASELIILGGFGTIASLTASYIFLGERLTLLQWTGALCILGAIMLVNYQHKNFRFHLGSLFALLGSTLYGFAVVFDGFILRTYDSFSFLPIVSLLPALILIVSFPKSARFVFSSLRKIDRHLVTYSILYICGAELFYIALTHGALVSQLTTVIRSSIIVTVILAMVFLKETSHPVKKFLGAILTTIGILIIR